MKKWFYGLTRAKQIIVGTLLAHVFCLLCLCVDSLFHPLPKKRQKVHVRTFQMQAPVARVASPQPAPKKTPPKPTASKNPTSPKSAKPKKPTPPTSKAPAVQTPIVPHELLQEIAANFDTITTPALEEPAKTVIHIPTLSYSAAAQEPFSQASSEEMLSSFLQQELTLPEFGEVKALLSIDRLGQLQSVEILAAKSEKNATFLKNRLPQLQFPCLNECISLTVIFSNAP